MPYLLQYLITSFIYEFPLIVTVKGDYFLKQR
jgi:hypothetical protein